LQLCHVLLHPIALWIHGGGLVDGESNDYDASALVKGGTAGPTVVVTINYRLGLLVPHVVDFGANL